MIRFFILSVKGSTSISVIRRFLSEDQRTRFFLRRFSIFLVGFVILTRFIFDPDLGWHLAIGSRFLENGEIVRGDPFSWTMPGYVFGNYFFLYQILVAFLFKNLGYLTTTIIFGLIGSFSVMLIVAKKLDFVRLVAVLLGIVMSAINLGLRTHMISFLFFAVLLVLLSREFFLRKWHAFFWFGFFALWANFHQGFFVGVLTFSAFVAYDFFWQKRNLGKRNLGVRARIMSVVAATLAGFLTPFHGYLWSSIADDLLGGKTWTFIAEWKPVAIYLPWNLLYAVSGMIFAYILFKKFKEVEPVWFILGTFIFMLPFLAVNFVFYWAAFFIYFASRHLELKVDLKGYLIKLPIIFASISCGIALVLAFFIGYLESLNLEYRLKRDGYPVEAVKFLKDEGLTSGVFNSYAWGGYIDLFAPEIRVFIDGRMTGWRKTDGGHILSDYVEIVRGNCKVVSEYDIRVVLMEEDFKNDCFSNFHEVYLHSVAKILVNG